MKARYKILMILIGILIICLAFTVTDYLRAKKDKKPIFVIKLTTHQDTGSSEYLGLGYKVIMYNQDTDAVFGAWSLKYNTSLVKTTVMDERLMFQIYASPETYGAFSEFRYKNADGNLYDIYYENLEGFAIKKEDSEYYHYLDVLLRKSEISIGEITEFLEEQVTEGKIEKEEYDDGGSILYKHSVFNFIQCKTLAGNKDVYIGKTTMKLESSYCINNSGENNE